MACAAAFHLAVFFVGFLRVFTPSTESFYRTSLSAIELRGGDVSTTLEKFKS